LWQFYFSMYEENRSVHVFKKQLWHERWKIGAMHVIKIGL
jgi:hypothetical protein